MLMRIRTCRSIVRSASLSLSSSRLSSSSSSSSHGIPGPLSSRLDAPRGQLSPAGQPYRVILGAKAAANHLGTIARDGGIHKMLIVRDRDAGAASRTQYIEFLLMQAGIPCFQHTLRRDCATVEDIDAAVAVAQRVGADGLVAFGGGSTMDMTRAVALLLANPTDVSAADYLRGDMDASELETPMPHILVPTTAGAGAEISTQALVLDEDGEVKQSLTSAPIVAEAVIVDPMLALSVPLHQTIQGAITALGQCIESYLLTESESDDDVAMALQGIDLVASALATPLVEGKVNLKSVDFREQLAMASLASGIAANASGFGAAHAIAVSMGGVSDLPHSQVASAFLPFVFDRYEALALENEGDEFFDGLADKLERVKDRLTAHSGFQGQSVAAWLRYVSQRFGLPDTSALELDEVMIKGLVDRAHQRQEAVMEDFEEGAILDKDDLRTIIDNAVVLAEPDKQQKQQDTPQ